MKQGNKRKRHRFELGSDHRWHQIAKSLRKIGPEKTLELIRDSGLIKDKEFHKLERQVKDNQQNLISVSTRVKTLDDLLREGEVDLEEWQVKSYVQNFWESGSKNPSGEILPCTLYQVKAVLIPKCRKLELIAEGILQEIRQATNPIKKKHIRKGDKILCVEIMITDFHIGKICPDDEGKNKWNLKECELQYEQVINNTIMQIDPSSIDHFLLPIGNDMLNIDSTHNTTTKGTPQMAGNYWEYMMIAAFKMCKRNIDKLSEIAPVYVPIVPGNHDKDSMFSLGGFLEAAFEKNQNVFIDNSIAKRKYHCFGANLIGYIHGNNIKARDLHAVMTTDVPEMFGKTKHRSFHLGHFHINRKSKVSFRDVKDEFQGVTVEICPTLCPSDRWHYEKGFIGALRRSKSFVWHKYKGLVTEIYYNL